MLLQNLKRRFAIFSSKLVQQEYEKIKSRQLPQFFKFSLSILTFTITYFLIFTLVNRRDTFAYCLAGALGACLLAFLCCNKLKRHLNLMFFLLCSAFAVIVYVNMKEAASSFVFAEAFIVGHICGTTEQVLTLRLANLSYKIPYSIIMILLTFSLRHIPYFWKIKCIIDRTYCSGGLFACQLNHQIQ